MSGTGFSCSAAGWYGEEEEDMAGASKAVRGAGVGLPAGGQAVQAPGLERLSEPLA